MLFTDFATPSGVLFVTHADTIPTVFARHQILPDQQAHCSAPLGNYLNISIPDLPQPSPTTKLSADPFNIFVNISTPDPPQPPQK